MESTLDGKMDCSNLNTTLVHPHLGFNNKYYFDECSPGIDFEYELSVNHD